MSETQTPESPYYSVKENISRFLAALRMLNVEQFIGIDSNVTIHDPYYNTYESKNPTYPDKRRGVRYKLEVEVKADADTSTHIEVRGVNLAPARISIRATAIDHDTQPLPDLPNIYFEAALDSDAVKKAAQHPIAPYLVPNKLYSNATAVENKNLFQEWVEELGDYEWCAYLNSVFVNTYYIKEGYEEESWLAASLHTIADSCRVIMGMDHEECHFVDLDTFQSTLPTSITFDCDSYTHEFDSCIVPYVEDAACDAEQFYRDNQEDPIIDVDNLESEPLQFTSGSEEELERLTTMVLHASIPLNVWDKCDLDSIDVSVRSSTDDGEEASIEVDDLVYPRVNSKSVRDILGDEHYNNITEALEAILSLNTPYGHTWEYNDGAYDRASGYDKSPHYVRFEIVKPSAHEQIGAKMELAKELNSIIGQQQVQKLLIDHASK